VNLLLVSNREIRLHLPVPWVVWAVSCAGTALHLGKAFRDRLVRKPRRPQSPRRENQKPHDSDRMDGTLRREADARNDFEHQQNQGKF